MARARAGQLTERVTFQKEVTVPDGGGGSVKTWQDVATCWAQVRPLRGSERAQFGAIQAPANYRIAIRRRTDIDESMRVVWSGHPEPGQIRFIAREGTREQFVLLDIEFAANT